MGEPRFPTTPYVKLGARTKVAKTKNNRTLAKCFWVEVATVNTLTATVELFPTNHGLSLADLVEQTLGSCSPTMVACRSSPPDIDLRLLQSSPSAAGFLAIQPTESTELRHGLLGVCFHPECGWAALQSSRSGLGCAARQTRLDSAHAIRRP